MSGAVEGAIAEVAAAVERERHERRLAQWRRYGQSEKGRVRYAHYNSTEKGRERSRNYDQSAPGRERADRYRQHVNLMWVAGGPGENGHRNRRRDPGSEPITRPSRGEAYIPDVALDHRRS